MTSKTQRMSILVKLDDARARRDRTERLIRAEDEKQTVDVELRELFLLDVWFENQIIEILENALIEGQLNDLDL